jgi:alpha-ketoglutarate-dependent taurine dioxygenase
MPYTHRSTPRTAVGDHIFTATEYPASQEIPLHNENAYQRDWPMHLAFCCLEAAREGGETPIADMRRISADIGPELMAKFRSRGVCYVRHYHPFVDIPWQTAFQTQNRDDVHEYCARHGIACEWLDGEVLRTTHTAQGTAVHPLTGEEVFFNQAHLFHVSNLGDAMAADLLHVFGTDRLPRSSFFGDREPITAAELQRVRSAFARHQTVFRWMAGDVLLIDNMRVAHGRRRYSGSRRLLAALLDPYSALQERPRTL